MMAKRIFRRRALWLQALLAFALLALFWALQWRYPPGFHRPQPVSAQDRVVLAAPLQVVLSGGDRYLAANLETYRTMSAGVDESGSGAAAEGAFRVRAYDVVSQLNACQEDAFSVANAMLTWGGAPREGVNILRRASSCRQWDPIPPFYLGIALASAQGDGSGARAALEQAAARASSDQQAAAYRRIGITLEAGTYASTDAALEFLRHEQAISSDPRLVSMLQRRIGRLEGLQQLEQAQTRFEEQFQRPLQAPDELLDAGLLDQFPQDPLGIGYVFAEGRFALKSNE